MTPKKYQDELSAWTGPRAWGCALSIFFVEQVIGVFFAQFGVSPSIFLCGLFIGLIVSFAVTILFSKCWSFRDFVTRFRLGRRPGRISWIGVVAGLSIALAIFYKHTPIRLTAPDYIYHSPQRQRHQYFLYMMLLGQLSPFLEEPVHRGFLYVAFRRSYGIVVATTLVVVFNHLLHLEVFATWYIFFMRTVLIVMWCYLRERTGNLWGCILSHWAYNSALDGRLRLFAMIVVILLCPFMSSKEINE